MSRPMKKALAAQLTTETNGLTVAVPDSVLSLISEVLRLNGRLTVTLTLCELQLLEVARRELRERGVCITFDVDEAEKVELAAGISRQEAQGFMVRRNRVVSVEFTSGTWDGTDLTKDIPFFTPMSK